MAHNFTHVNELNSVCAPCINLHLLYHCKQLTILHNLFYLCNYDDLIAFCEQIMNASEAGNKHRHSRRSDT